MSGRFDFAETPQNVPGSKFPSCHVSRNLAVTQVARRLATFEATSGDLDLLLDSGLVFFPSFFLYLSRKEGPEMLPLSLSLYVLWK